MPVEVIGQDSGLGAVPRLGAFLTALILFTTGMIAQLMTLATGLFEDSARHAIEVFAVFPASPPRFATAVQDSVRDSGASPRLAAFPPWMVAQSMSFAIGSSGGFARNAH